MLHREATSGGVSRTRGQLHLNERSTRGPGRRVGRDRVLAAAIERMASADLADLLSFLGMRAVADEADVAPTTVHHHFANRDDNPKTNARLAAAVLDAALGLDIVRQTVDELAEMLDRPTLDIDDMAHLRAMTEANFAAIAADRALIAGRLVGALAASDDAVARGSMREHYGELERAYAAGLERLADHLDRDFDVARGFTATAMSVFCAALSDGLMMRHQFDPDDERIPIYGEIVLWLLEKMTVSRLVGEARGLVPTVDPDPAERWVPFVPELERRLGEDRARDMPVGRAIERHLHRVVDLVKAHPELGALPADPLPSLLVPLISESAEHLRPGLADSTAEALDLATTVMNLVLLRAVSHPEETTSDAVQRIADLVLEGILVR